MFRKVFESVRYTINEDYNGWTNWETWQVNLWVTNEEGAYKSILVHAKERYTADTAKKAFEKLYPQGTPDMVDRNSDWEEVSQKVNWDEIAEAWNEDIDRGFVGSSSDPDANEMVDPDAQVEEDVYETDLYEAWTKKDFILLAQILKDNETREDIARAVVQAAKEQNPRFDEARFLKAAGMGGE